MAVLEIAIDLGSCNTVLYKKGSGIVLKEPSLVCLQTTQRAQRVVAVGFEAKKLSGKTSEDLRTVSPVQYGIIKNVELTSEMLKEFLKKVTENKRKIIQALVAVPCGISEDELKDFQQVMFNCKIYKFNFVSSLVCANIGSANTSSTISQLILNIGGGKTEIGTLVGARVINGISLTIGGKTMDNHIVDYVADLHSLQIAHLTAEKIKMEIGSLFENDKSNIEVSGADIKSSRLVSDIIMASEIYKPLNRVFASIVKAIYAILKECSPEIIAELHEKGILVCGGSAKLSGIESFLHNATMLPVVVDENADSLVAIGAGKILGDAVLFNQIINS